MVRILHMKSVISMELVAAFLGLPIIGILGFSVLTKHWDIGTASHRGQGWDTGGDVA